MLRREAQAGQRRVAPVRLEQLVAGLRWVGRVGDRHAADVVGEGDARPRLLDGQPAEPLLYLGDDLGAFGVGELELGRRPVDDDDADRDAAQQVRAQVALEEAALLGRLFLDDVDHARSVGRLGQPTGEVPPLTVAWPLALGLGEIARAAHVPGGDAELLGRARPSGRAVDRRGVDGANRRQLIQSARGGWRRGADQDAVAVAMEDLGALALDRADRPVGGRPSAIVRARRAAGRWSGRYEPWPNLLSMNEVLVLLDADARTTTRELAARAPLSGAGAQLFGDRVAIARLEPDDCAALAGVDGVCGVFEEAVPADVEVPADLAGRLAVEAWNQRKSATAMAEPKQRIGDGAAWDDPRFEREGEPGLD